LSENKTDKKTSYSKNSPINPKSSNHLKKQRKSLSVSDYVNGIFERNRAVLSRAITLIESTKPEHRKQAEKIIEKCLPKAGNSIRIGITGVPGAGKSTFIEAIGSHVIEKGRKLAVLAIDPSSTQSGGSILGDKTRMETLANNPDAFIRPSPTAGTLGGVARATRETIFLCEAAGYDTIFIETVGVGQSDIAVHSMVDLFLLLMLAGAGDELQGIKRGIMEMADVIAINKIDSQPDKQVQQAVRQYKNALRLYPSAESGWEPKVTTCSALKETGVREIWEIVEEYISLTRENGFFGNNRKEQALHWMHETIHQQLKEAFYHHAAIKEVIGETEKEVLNGEISSFKAARKLLDMYSDYN
jgi:LAO/AO transport system kinase